jgi:nicotinamidase-related amidase
MPSTPLDPTRTAVLCMDYQLPMIANHVPAGDALLARASKVLDAARASKIRVIYVVLGFRPGFPEAGLRNQSIATMIKTRGAVFVGEGARIHADVAPRDGEVTVTKHRVSAFAGTDLEMILRANDIDTLVLMGLSTGGVVLSTLRHAADADYRALVVRDCCADADLPAHDCLMEKIFPRQATVVTSEEICAALKGDPTSS